MYNNSYSIFSQGMDKLGNKQLHLQKSVGQDLEQWQNIIRSDKDSDRFLLYI